MKKLLLISLLVSLFVGCNKYDDDGLWNSVHGLENRISTLEQKVSQMNTEITTMQSLVRASVDGKAITSLTETSTGYLITFNDGNTITINHGTNGTNAPVIGIDVENGCHYWTLTSDGLTDWLMGSGNKKLPVTGTTPIMGIDTGGCWTVDYGTGAIQVKDAGNNPIQATGEKGDNGDSFFSSVAENGDMVTFTLSSGSTISIPKSGNFTYSIGSTAVQCFQYGETREFTITQNGVQNIAVSKPDGWKASVNGNKLTVTAPAKANSYAEQSGIVSIVAIGKSTTTIASMEVRARDYNYLIDFEDSRVLDYLAGPTSYGENLYSNYTGTDRYYGYDDLGSGLYMMVNDPYYTGDPDFWSGGIAISQWNNMVKDSYTNQCSVYHSDATTGFGGYNGSKTFAVGFGYNDPMMMGDMRSTISFYDNTTECAFDHFWVTNNTYVALSMLNGDMFAKKFGLGDWFKLIIHAFDKNENPTGTPVEFYLADFRTATSPGIVTEWTMVDLTPLGNHVNTVKFDLQSSDTGMYGMNTPGYFCFDNLALKK